MTQLDRLEALLKSWLGGGDLDIHDVERAFRLLLPDLIRVARAAKELKDFFGRLPGEPDRIDKLADALAPLFAEVEP